MTILIMASLKMTILITLNPGEITYNGIKFNIIKCNNAYMFLSTVMSKVIVSNVSISIVIASFNRDMSYIREH